MLTSPFYYLLMLLKPARWLTNCVDSNQCSAVSDLCLPSIYLWTRVVPDQSLWFYTVCSCLSVCIIKVITAWHWHRLVFPSLTPSMLGKNLQTTLWNIFLLLPRKLALIFHANCLFWDNLHEISKPILLGKIKQKYQCVVCWSCPHIDEG